MSNRTPDHITAEAEMRLSHMAQIEALTRPGLDDDERVEMFGAAAGFNKQDWEKAWSHLNKLRDQPAFSVWVIGGAEKSLFAYLPGCGCPVQERLPGVPQIIPSDWRPTVADLEPFSRIQLERRFGSVTPHK